MTEEAKAKKPRKPRRSSRYIVLQRLPESLIREMDWKDDTEPFGGPVYAQITQAETLKKAEANVKHLDIEGEFMIVCIRKKFSIKEVKQMKLIAIPVKSIEQEKYEEAKKGTAE